MITGYSLNACADRSSLGDVKVYLDPKGKTAIKADMKKLPFKDNTFDTVLQDPPRKMGHSNRRKPFSECVRVCKVGETIIYNARWLPQSDDVELLECFIRHDQPFANISIISVFKKIRHTGGKSKLRP